MGVTSSDALLLIPCIRTVTACDLLVGEQEGDLDTVRAFFDSVHDMTFSFVIKSRGWGGGLDRNREVCLLVRQTHVLSSTLYPPSQTSLHMERTWCMSGREGPGEWNACGRHTMVKRIVTSFTLAERDMT